MKLSSLLNINKLSLKKIKKNELEKLRNERNSHEVRKKMLNQEIISKKKQLIWFKEISKSKNTEQSYGNLLKERGHTKTLGKTKIASQNIFPQKMRGVVIFIFQNVFENQMEYSTRRSIDITAYHAKDLLHFGDFEISIFKLLLRIPIYL